MGARSIVPLIDLVFLTLGAILAAMTQMERVTALPVDVAQVGPGAAMIWQGDFSVLSLRADGMAIDGQPIETIPATVAGRQIVVRAERTLETQTLLEALAELVRLGAEVSLEVEEGTRELPDVRDESNEAAEIGSAH